MKSDALYLHHILDAIEAVERFTAGMTINQFLGDEKTKSAVVHEITVIGEATTHLSEDFQEAHPEIPFYKVRGMRNRIIHEYWSIDEHAVWDTCQVDLPSLKAVLTQTLGERRE